MRQGAGADRWMFFAVLALLGIGITMVLSTSYLYSQERFLDGTYLFRKQLVAVGVGLVCLFVSALIPPRLYRRMAYPLLGLSLVTLVMVLVPEIGLSRGGSRRWLPLGNFAFQPAELAKLALVFYLARSLGKKEEQGKPSSIRLLPYLIVGGVFLGLVLMEPDFGGAAILGGLVVLVLFVAGVRLVHLFGIGIAALPLLAFVLVGADYRMRRLTAFLDPWGDAGNAGFQVVQSYIAFGSGRVWGQGLGQSRQKLFYLPEAHTDFIFSVIGEELGLLGALLVLALFGVLLWRGYRMATQIEDPFCQYLAFGLSSLFGLQALIHMGVVMGLMPTKGLVLPFISYGGSAMVVNLAAAGILLGLSRRRVR